MPILDELAAIVATRIKASQDRCQAMEQDIRRIKAECELMIVGGLAHDRERIAALEARPYSIAGPPGDAGPPGPSGAQGPPGPPGPMGKFSDSYKDIYDHGATYTQGDLVTDDGSLWLCKAGTTTDRPGRSAAWRLICKRGKDGKDAKDPR